MEQAVPGGWGARHLQPRCMALAKQDYREQKSENKRRNQAALNQAATTTKKTIKELRLERNQKLRQAQAAVEPFLEQLTERRDEGLLAAETAFQEKQAELDASREEQAEENGGSLKTTRRR